jgi:hypothetical protein
MSGIIRDWRVTLVRLVHIAPIAKQKPLFPMVVFEALPPNYTDWPNQLPVAPTLIDFYRRSDGGYFNHYHWFRLTSLIQKTHDWINLLTSSDEDRSVLNPQRHVVFATDSAGAPVIWDSHADHVASYWFKSGYWEPLASSMEQFLEKLFNPDDETSVNESLLWTEALVQLDQLYPEDKQ